MAQPPAQNPAPPPPIDPSKPALPPRPLAGAAAGMAAGAAITGKTNLPADPSQIAALQNPDGEAPPEDGLAIPHPGFFQQPWVQDILPFVTSLALHATIVILGLLLYEGIKQAGKFIPTEEQIIIPESQMASDVAGGVENPGLGSDPTRAAAQDKYDDQTTPDGTAFERSDSDLTEAAGGGEGDSANALIGAGTGSFSRGSGSGFGEGDGSGSGSGKGRGRLAPFGAPGGGMVGPRGKVFGDGGNARTIAFCCDSSGSMIDKFPALKQELAKAIEGLKPIQQFSIVFFADGKAHLFENGTLVSATVEAKRKANKWLDDLTTSGTSDPIPGLQVALRGKPDLMYILTDGDFPNNADVLSTVGNLNSGKKTRVNTIAFVSSSDDPTSESFLKFLTTLADQNNGKFKRVAQDQLD